MSAARPVMEGRAFAPLTFFVLFLSSPHPPSRNWGAAAAAAPFDVGVILDLDTLVGKMSRASISLAVEDFYAAHPNYTARLVLHARDSGRDVVGAAADALDLLKNVQVQAIVGPLTSSQAEFVSHLGSKSHVPVISFSATSPSLSPARSGYFIRTATNDTSQVPCIVALLKLYGWRQVVPVYDDTGYGTSIVPYFVDAFQQINVQIPYRSVIQTAASDDQIRTELYKLQTMAPRVFLVHMSSALASRLFRLAEMVGMMGPGYVWIITDGITSLLDSMDPSVLESMQGVLGVRSYVPMSKQLAGFTARWRLKIRQENPEIVAADPSVFSLWAYDTIWALATAAQRVGGSKPYTFPAISATNNSTDLGTIGVSPAGPELRKAIADIRFKGISGDFSLVDGQLQSSAFQIVNVNGRSGRVVGFWTVAGGISRKPEARKGNNTQTADPSPSLLGPVIWPGESTAVPKGWEMPTSGKKMRVAVPVKQGFQEFVDVEYDPATNRTEVTGYCIDVFDRVMARLPYAVPFAYVPYNATSYDDLVHQVFTQKFDVAVGDITILGYRSTEVDFTLPFTESGWSMIVPVTTNRVKSAWIFVKPWSMGLWAVSFAFFLFTGFVVWMIEHRVNPEFRGPPLHQLGMVFYFSFSTMVFAHKERIVSNFSRFVVIVWVFVVFILQSSFTASLASLLTVQQLEPTVTDVGELLRNRDKVGYQAGSFVYERIRAFGFDNDSIVSYDTPEEYADALAKGPLNGGVSAIFDEVPYIKVFLSKYCGDYTMAGPIYKTDGFGFVFPRGSPLVPDVSRAILNLTEGPEMTRIEKKWFEVQGGGGACAGGVNNQLGSSALGLESFQWLFAITGGVSALALLLFLAIFFYQNWNKLDGTPAEEPRAGKRTVAWLKAWLKHYDKKDLSSHTFRKQSHGSMIHPDDSIGFSPISASTPQSPLRYSIPSSNDGGGGVDRPEGAMDPGETRTRTEEGEPSSSSVETRTRTEEGEPSSSVETRTQQ